MSIPLRTPKPLDPLEVFRLEKAHWGQTGRSSQLDLRAYWDAIRQGKPIPTFQMLDAKCEKAVGRPRLIDAQLLKVILGAQLPCEDLDHNPELDDLAQSVSVHAIVIRDLRKRFNSGSA